MSTISRRTFLTATAAATVGACARKGAEIGALNLPNETHADAPLYFSDAERQFIDAAVARLIPNDELGPGARETGVTYFIDRQLAGPFGHARTWYMQGPWAKGTEQQGYQLKLTPAELYRAAIADIDAYCSAKHGKTFAQLKAAEQDGVLHLLETKGAIDLPNVPASTFFSMFLQNTFEGFLSDPMYGGNRDFAGWKLIGFPGPRYNYVEDIEQHGKPYAMPPVGLLGRSGGKRSES
jgi:gluconate 2-dehydrogenase gamma chain